LADIWSHTIRRDGSTSTVLLSGEIDMSVHEAILSVLLDQLNDPTSRKVRADLAGVSFIDSSGLHALVKARQAADRLGRAFTVSGAKGPVLEVLDLTDLTMLLGEDPGDTGA
jgi:anti-sigma B factor antagonist